MSNTSNEKTLLAKIAVFIRPFRFQLIGMAILTVMISLAGVLPPLLLRSVINDVIVDRHTELMPRIITGFIVVTVVTISCSYIQLISMAVISQSFVMKIRNAVYDHMLKLSMSFFSREGTGKLVNRLMGDSTVLQEALSVTSLQVIADLVSASFAISATLFINWRLAIPLYIIVILFALNIKLRIGELRRLSRVQRIAEDRVAAGVQNRLAANLTVKTYGTESREDEYFHTQSSTSLDLERDGRIATADFWRNTELLRDGGHKIVFFIGCAMVLSGTASYGDVTAFCSYAMLLLTPAVRFSLIAQQFQSIKVSAERLFEILGEESLVVERPGAVALKECRGEIHLENIHFGYTPEKEVIKGISLDVMPGETIALVGTTGCGKSTILSLLMRLYDVTDGRITIDGKDIRELTLKSLRTNFGIVLQESLLFSVSIADNIRYGRPHATMKQIEFAAKIAEIHNEIVAMPKGYESRIGDPDVHLSVGQKQRIAIARAILADPAILVMDEATSSLDTNSERAIQTALDRFLTGRTAFIVAHRLSTIRNADKIVFIDQGKIVECGPHEELVKIEGGRYRKLYETHAAAGTISEEEG